MDQATKRFIENHLNLSEDDHTNIVVTQSNVEMIRINEQINFEHEICDTIEKELQG